MLKTYIFDDLQEKTAFYGKICALLFVTLSHMIGLTSMLLQKTWNTFTLSNIYILMHNNTFVADFLLKTWNFHCTRRSKNWEFQILQIIDFLKNNKNDPRVAGLAQIARMCFLIMHQCVMVIQRHRNHYFLNLHTPSSPFSTPRPPPLKKDVSSKICWNLIFQSRFSCWFWELVELLMALKCSLRSSLSCCPIV